MALRTLEGQATELGWRRDQVDELAPEDYLDLIMHKTCWYTTVHPLRVGALVGSRGVADLRPMVRFGFYLGAAFQIQDDLLNLVGTEASTERRSTAICTREANIAADPPDRNATPAIATRSTAT